MEILLNLVLIAAVEELYIKLYQLFSKELEGLNIGYEFNKSRLREMMGLVNAIDYIQHSNPDRREIIRIISYYG